MAHLPVTWRDVAAKDDLRVLSAALRTTEIVGLRTSSRCR